MNPEVWMRAQLMYTSRVAIFALGPRWEQLGPVTQRVWYEKALRVYVEDLV